jgi:hypothetical protein
MALEKKVNKSAKKVDKVITWLIIGTAVASMIWLSRTNRWKKITNNVKTWVIEWYNKWKSMFWRCLIAIINFFKKK